MPWFPLCIMEIHARAAHTATAAVAAALGETIATFAWHFAGIPSELEFGDNALKIKCPKSIQKDCFFDLATQKFGYGHGHGYGYGEGLFYIQEFVLESMTAKLPRLFNSPVQSNCTVHGCGYGRAHFTHNDLCSIIVRQADSEHGSSFSRRGRVRVAARPVYSVKGMACRGWTQWQTLAQSDWAFSSQKFKASVTKFWAKTNWKCDAAQPAQHFMILTQPTVTEWTCVHAQSHRGTVLSRVFIRHVY